MPGRVGDAVKKRGAQDWEDGQGRRRKGDSQSKKYKRILMIASLCSSRD